MVNYDHESKTEKDIKMAIAATFGQRWREYRPSKALWFWSGVGCAALTMVVGFTWGGWVTGGGARNMVEDAAEQGRAELAATVCVDRFLAASDADVQLASLKAASTYARDDFIEKGGWAILGGMEKPVAKAAQLCGDELAKMELPPKGEAMQTGEGATAVQ